MSACVIWTLALGAAWRSMGTTTPKTMATATMAMATSSIVDTTLLMAFLRVFLLVRDSLYVCIPVQSGCTTPLKVGFAVLVLVLFWGWLSVWLAVRVGGCVFFSTLCSRCSCSIWLRRVVVPRWVGLCGVRLRVRLRVLVLGLPARRRSPYPAR